MAKEIHTIIEFGCWYCRLSAWLRHRFNRCHGWCSYCMAEADKFEANFENKRQEWAEGKES